MVTKVGLEGAPETRSMGVRRWLREPLLHFFLIGALLFFAYGRIAPANKNGERIVVTQAIVSDLAGQHQTRWSRPPSQQELASLEEAYVLDEIKYREGLALGLDRDDAVIKRRVLQKIELVLEEQQVPAAPTDAELAAYLAKNADRFKRPEGVSFEQIYFDGSASVATVKRELAEARTALAKGADPANLGQVTMLPHSVQAMPLDLVARDFGERFAEQTARAPQGEWVGPIASGLGAHLVRVTARTPAALPALEEVRPQVLRDWENEWREHARAQQYRQLRDRYEVVIEPASPQARSPQS